MKKFVIFILMAFVAVSVSAQIEQGCRIGVRINGGISKMNEYEWNKATFGYGAAFVAEYNFLPKLFIQSGVGIENIAYEDFTDKINVFYAQVPVNIGYRYILKNGNACFIQAGPTFGIGLHGPDIIMNGESTSKVNYFDSNDRHGAHRFDLGLGGRLGIEIRKFQISVGANYGALKVTRKGGHNLSVNLGLGYMF